MECPRGLVVGFRPTAGGVFVLARQGRLFRERLAHKTHGAQIPLNLHRQRLTLRIAHCSALGLGCRVICHTAQGLVALIQDLDFIEPEILQPQAGIGLLQNNIVIRVQAAPTDQRALISGGLWIFFCHSLPLWSGLPAG